MRRAIYLATAASTAALLALLAPTAEAQSDYVLTAGLTRVGIESSGYGRMCTEEPPPNPWPPSITTGTQIVCFRYIDTVTGLGYEALSAPQSSGAAYNHGWGLARDGTASGYCVRSTGACPGSALSGGPVVCTVPTTCTQGPKNAALLQVTHLWARHAIVPEVFQVDVTIRNSDAVAHNSITYRRIFDWKVEPTPQNEIVEIQGIPLGGGNLAPLLYFSDNGRIATSGAMPNAANPLDPLLAPVCAAPLTYFTGCTGDRGGAFDFNFGTLQPNQEARFCMYYGAADSAATARARLYALGAELYSMARSNSFNSNHASGEYPSFFIGFDCITPARASFNFTQPPVPGFPVAWPRVCAMPSAAMPYRLGGPVFFTDTSVLPGLGPARPAVSAEWDWGDATPNTVSAGGATVTHGYANPGAYSVTLTITDDHGQRVTAALPIVVEECTPANQRPEFATMGCPTLEYGSLHELFVMATDPDVAPKHSDYYALRLTAITLPAGVAFPPTDGAGTVSRSLSWRPPPGTHAFRFHVVDAHRTDALAAEGNACVTVLPPSPPDAPRVMSDADRDGIVDAWDNCAAVANDAQSDVDGDGWGDACDPDFAPAAPVEDRQEPVDPELTVSVPPPGAEGPDADGDGIVDSIDNCPGAPNPTQLDLDRDRLGDVCDADIDNDGVNQLRGGRALDNCPYAFNPDQSDRDGDGAGDVCQGDRDGDGVPDSQDICPWWPNPMQAADPACPAIRDPGPTPSASAAPTVLSSGGTGGLPWAWLGAGAGAFALGVAFVAWAVRRRSDPFA